MSENGGVGFKVDSRVAKNTSQSTAIGMAEVKRARRMALVAAAGGIRSLAWNVQICLSRQIPRLLLSSQRPPGLAVISILLVGRPVAVHPTFSQGLRGRIASSTLEPAMCGGLSRENMDVLKGEEGKRVASPARRDRTLTVRGTRAYHLVLSRGPREEERTERGREKVKRAARGPDKHRTINPWRAHPNRRTFMP